MRIRELAAALSDLDEALGHYGNISPIFSQALLDEIKVAKRLIAEYPRAWKPLAGGIRGFPLHRYPYLIVYLAGDDEILIVAYAHFKRSPNYWHGRKTTA